MKVLIVGATGNIGLRLVAALLTHGFDVVAFVRSSGKLSSLLPSILFQQLTVTEGNAKDSDQIKQAVLDAGCDAVVNAAGLASVAPWSKGDFPEIFQAVLNGVRDAGVESKKPLRAWFLGGQGVLFYPGTQKMLSSYVPIYLEHRQNLRLLKSLPPNTVNWSMLCPQNMTAESSDLVVPAKSKQGKLVASAEVPPLWYHPWISFIPFIGKFLAVAMNASRYETTLEQNAEFIADDLETLDSSWSEMTVGVIDAKN